MRPTTFKSGILASTLLAGLGAITPALAQDVEQTEPQAEAQAEAQAQAQAEDEIVVTGSRIQAANLVSTSPVTQVSAEELDLRGIVRVEDMINTLPQAFAAQGSAISNGSTGTATVNLRGLGAARTLVLVNGRRLPFGSPLAVPADLNQIPSALVERVEVLTGGASAVYGSDAISGVVNFIMMDDFEGVRIDTQYSFYQHKNDNDEISDIVREFGDLNPSQYQVPEENVTDGEAFEITGVIGVNSPDGRGNVTAYAGYRTVDPVLQRDRDYSACALGTTNGGQEFTCSGSSTNAIANFLDFQAAVPTGLWFRTTPDGEFIARDFVSDTFNFNPYNYYQRPDERYTLGAYAHYEVNDYFEPYAELSYMNDRTRAQIAPSGVFGGGIAGTAGGINCNNPFLSDQQVDFLCRQGRGFTDAEIAAGAVAEDVIILRRNVEGGNRTDDLQHINFRQVIGTRGDFFGPFEYDVYGSFSQVTLVEDYENEISVERVSKALNAVRDGSGNIVCAVNADANTANDDPACVPYDIFSGNGPSQASLDYIIQPLLLRGETQQQVLSGSIFGDLTEWGWVSPWAENGAAIALGAEYRRDYLDVLPDRGFQTGDGFGQGGPTTPVSGSTDVYEIFGELQIPLIQDRPFIENLSVEGAYRYSEYSTDVTTDTYKLASEWSPSQDLRFRGSYQRAVRAPNVVELFSSQSIGLFDLNQGANGLYDPCSGTNPAATLEQCARTGVTPAQYGRIADNPAGQFNALFGGNPNLDPEKSDTYAFGVIATPSFLPGLNLTIDYFDISVEDAIGTIPPSQALDQCLTTGDPTFCNLINRGEGGTLWANPTGFIVATNINTGSLETSGVDLNVNYGFEFADYGMESLPGGLSFDLVATWLDKFKVTDFPGAEPYDCVGFYGSTCGTPTPEWRHKLRMSWNTPWDLSLTGTWRYFDSVNIDSSSDQPSLSGSFADINKTLDSQNYFDLAAFYTFTENTRFRAGVNNIFDEEPPLTAAAGAGFGNGNTYPQVYDALGRYIFAGVTVDF